MRRFRRPSVFAALAAVLMLGVFTGCEGDTVVRYVEIPPPPPPPINAYYDIIVIGGGMSGTATALAAAEAGLSVLLVEKRASLGGVGGGGALGAVGTATQARHDIVDDDPVEWENLWTIRDNQVFGRDPFGLVNPSAPIYAQPVGPRTGLRNPAFPDMDAVRWMVRGSAAMITWMEGHGFVFGRPWSLAQDIAERYHSTPGGGIGKSIQLAARAVEMAAEGMDVHIRLNTRAMRIIQEAGPGSRVTGVELHDGRIINTQAVVLAAGGFTSEMEPWMQGHLGRQHLDFHIQDASLENDWWGEGILMGVAAGGELWDDPWAIGLGAAQAVDVRAGLGTVGRTASGMLFDATIERRPGFENNTTGVNTSYAMAAQMRGGRLFAIVSQNIFDELLPGMWGAPPPQRARPQVKHR